MRVHRTFLTPLAALALTALTSGQSAQQTKPAASHAAAPPPTITLRLLAFSSECEKDTVYLHDPAAQPTSPDAPPAPEGTKADVKPYLNHENVGVMARGNRIVMTDQAEGASATKPANILCNINIPEHVHSAIVVVFPAAPGAKPPMQALTISDATSTFPRGSFLVLNRSPLPVKLSLESKTFGFKPGETQLIKDPPVGPNHNSAMYAYAFQANDWKRIGSGFWPHPGTKRSVQVLYFNPGSQYVELRSFNDIAVRDPAPASSVH